MAKNSVIKKIFRFIYKKAEYLWQNKEEIISNLEEKAKKRKEELEKKMDAYYVKYNRMEFSYLEDKCRKLAKFKRENPNYKATLEEFIMIKVYKERSGK